MQRADTAIRHVPSPLSRSDSPASIASSQQLPRHSSIQRSSMRASPVLKKANGTSSPYYVPSSQQTESMLSGSSAQYTDSNMPGGFPDVTAKRREDVNDDDDDDDDTSELTSDRPSVIPDVFQNGYASSSVDYDQSQIGVDTVQPVQKQQQQSLQPPVSTVPGSAKPTALVRNTPARQSTIVEKRAPTGDDPNSAFVTPVPVSGNPTEVLSARFSSWRKVLKETVGYFEEAAVAQDARSRSYGRLSGLVAVPFKDTADTFLRQGGIQETAVILRDYHKQSAYHSADAARQITEQIVPRLKDLRRDLSFKIKEIKGLSGDFKNSVAKELELTKKQAGVLTEALNALSVNPHLVSGKYDPYIVKLSVEKQLRKQIEEENYLHQAYLNIESSGKALEEIVVKEIQQAFDRFCSLMNREGQETLDFAHRLTINMVELPPSKEWNSFVVRDVNFVDPSIPIRKVESVVYPGRDNPATKPIRSGPLERRTKYLKSYTSAWYVLTPLYLHEFKTSDRKNDLTPVMSLFLQDCHLSDHSDQTSHSFKFLMKGKQTGQFHRGHSWMFRAESYEQMMTWYNDIKNLTDVDESKSGVDKQSPSTAVRQSSEYYNSADVRQAVLKNRTAAPDESRLSYDSSGSILDSNR
ncbi:hypothetical protein V1512DRAFT_268208 [Lipomyces arxii]|uniref:uncharacterized protein n=1 Tax=Lipomyces arxii TaxID=56418 RepID=UPI0034CF6026